jgi:hypothetical protein
MGRVEEGVHLSDYTCEIIDYLQRCFDLLETDEEDRILGDPFYRRARDRPPLSEEDVDRVIGAIDAEFATEIGTYPEYHRNRSGANATPDFSRFSPRARRCVAEGLDAILSRYLDQSA